MLYFLINNIPGGIANIYRELRLTTWKLQKTTSSIGFIEHALHWHVTPKFAIIKVQFL